MGDRLTEEQRRLVAENLGLARVIARPFLRRWPSHAEDLEAAAYLGLARAAAGFDPSRGRAFGTFAARPVKWELLAAVERLRRRGFTGSDDPPACVAFQLDQVEAREPAGPGPAADAGQLLQLVHNDRHRGAARAVYLEGRSQAEAAAAIGVSQMAVSRYCRLAVEAIRERWPVDSR